MKRILSIFWVVIIGLQGFSQVDTVDFEWEDVSREEAMNLFYDAGYLTIAGGVGNIEPLIFEGNIIPYYQMGFDVIRRWFLVVSPQIILRMYNDYSYPVRTPSYMPRVILVHHSARTRKYHDWFQYVSWWHHSNGQDGDFYLSDSTTINTHNGSFSTNWLEAGAFVSRGHSSRQYYCKMYTQYCYQLDPNLRGIYDRLRLKFDLKFEWDIAKTIRNNFKSNFKEGKEIILSNTLKLGARLGGNPNSYNKHFTIDYTMSFKPSFLQDVTFFTQFYWGEDYYNIYFNRSLRVLRFGITAQTQFFSKETKLPKN